MNALVRCVQAAYELASPHKRQRPCSLLEDIRIVADSVAAQTGSGARDETFSAQQNLIPLDGALGKIQEFAKRRSSEAEGVRRHYSGEKGAQALSPRLHEARLQPLAELASRGQVRQVAQASAHLLVEPEELSVASRNGVTSTCA